MLEQMLIELNKKIPDKLAKKYMKKDIDSIALTYDGNEFLFQLLCNNSYDSYDIFYISVEDMKKYMDLKDLEQDNELEDNKMQYDLSGFSLEQLKIIKKEIEVEIKNRDQNFKDKFKKEIEINIFNNTNFVFLLSTYGFNNKYNSGNEIPLNIIEDINNNIDLFLSKFEKNSDIVKKDLKIEILPNINKFMNFIHCGGGYSLNRCAITFRSLYDGKSIEEAFSPNSQNWINDLKLSENKEIYKNNNLTFDNLINFIKNELNDDIKIKLILNDKEHLFEINDINSLNKNEISF